jgi:predicted HicB family RNase H-like nuclease
MMEYKGYAAKVEFDDDAEIFHSEVIGIKDVVTSECPAIARSSRQPQTVSMTLTG